MRKIKDYKICIVLVLFQIVLVGFVTYYLGCLESAQIIMAACIVGLGIVIDIWVYISLVKVKEKEKMEQQVQTMLLERTYEQENLKKAHNYIVNMEEKRKQFYLTLNELYDRCNEGKDVEGIQQAYDKMSLSLNNMRIDKYCESPIVNAVITSKYEEMKANDIEMKIAIDEIADDIGIERIDLCSVFCNLLDNAIEACQKLDENRFINIRAKKQTGYLTIAVENCYKGKIDKKLIGYKTSKENSNEHGYGTKILALIAERYKGRFYLEESGEMVKAVVLLKL